MKKLLSIIFACCSLNISAQVFESIVDMGMTPVLHSLVQSQDGGQILFAADNPDGYGLKRIIKIDAAGNVVWSWQYNSSFFCASTLGENYFALYDYHETIGWPNTYERELCVFDNSGLLIRTITIPESLVVENMHSTSDGGTISIGVETPSMIMRTDSTGTFEWIKYIDTLYNNFYVNLSDIIEAKSGGYIAIGSYYFPDTINSASYTMLVRLNDDGDTLWTKSFENFHPYKIYNSSENGFLILCGEAIVNLDSLGNIKWAKALEHISFPYYYLTDCALSSDSNFVFSGYEINNYPMPFLLKIDTSGSLIWFRKYPGAGYFYGNCIVNCADSGYALSAVGSPVGNNSENILLIKTDSIGVSVCDSLCVLPTTIPYPVQSTPHYYSIHVSVYSQSPFDTNVPPGYSDSVYSATDNCLLLGETKITPEPNPINIFPNPATDQFVVESSEFRQNSILEILNLLGEKIFTVAYCGPLTVDCEHLPRGIYFVRLINSEKHLTQKLIVE